jgi:hypothetical protein
LEFSINGLDSRGGRVDVVVGGRPWWRREEEVLKENLKESLKLGRRVAWGWGSGSGMQLRSGVEVWSRDAVLVRL